MTKHVILLISVLTYCSNVQAQIGVKLKEDKSPSFISCGDNPKFEKGSNDKIGIIDIGQNKINTCSIKFTYPYRLNNKSYLECNGYPTDIQIRTSSTGIVLYFNDIKRIGYVCHQAYYNGDNP